MHTSIRQPSSEVRGRWVRSSRCTPSNDCVELNISAMALRDSKNAAGGILELAPTSWRALLSWCTIAS